MIALGTLITYSHQAAVARKAGSNQYIPKGEWFIPTKGNGELPAKLAPRAPFKPNGEAGVKYIDGEGNQLSAELLDKYNKVVIAWEQPGSGVVTGLVAKQVGVSTPGGGYTNMYGEGDYDQGYFVRYGNVELYTVRYELRGSNFIYVPTWAAEPHNAMPYVL